MGTGKPIVVSPLHDWVLLRKFEQDVTEGGIIIPDSAQESLPVHATVVAVGPGHFNFGKLIEPRVSVGDKVWLHPKAEAITMPVNGETLAMVPYSGILGVVHVEGN